MVKNDLTGQKFTRLLVLGLDEEKTHEEWIKKGRRGSWWKCQCDCGNITSVRSDCLMGGGTRSCGCLTKEKSAERCIARSTHGMSRGRSSEYDIWCSMKQRAYDPNHKSYKNYGGRGIKVCDRWLHSFENFYADMGPRPSKKHSLERIDMNGNYCPENCKWATKKEQANNTRRNVVFDHQGQRKTLMELSEEYSIPYKTLHCRVTYYGWPIDKALTTPIRHLNSYQFEYRGQILNSVELAKALGVPWGAINGRIRMGWSPEKIINTPVISKRRKDVTTPR